MAERADNLDGSCYQVETGKHAGKWRVQFTFRDELGRKKRSSRLFAQKKNAKEFLQSLRHGARIEAKKQSQEMTLSAWIDWLSENDWPENLDEKTIAYRKSQFNKYVKNTFGNTPLVKINPLMVRAFYSELRTRGVGTPTIHNIKTTLVRVFNQAISPYQQVPLTVANPFRLNLHGSPRRDAVALSPSDARKALSIPTLSPDQKGMLATFLLAGLRLGEVMALSVGQVLFDMNQILVDRAVRIDPHGKQTVGLPKGNKTRSAVLCQKLAESLRPLCDGKRPDDLLWPSETGKPKMKKRVYDIWKVIVKTSGLPPEMSPHDCRLTHINWIEKLLPEVSSTTLKEHVGHAAVGVTEVNYTRPITPAQDILRKGLDRLIKEPKQKKAARAEPPPNQ